VSASMWGHGKSKSPKKTGRHFSVVHIECLYRQNVYMKNSASASTALLQGTLDVLILKVLALEPLHGLGISRRIAQVTGNTFQVKPGSLFPALHRMEEAGWLSSGWGESENTRRAKFYRLTKAGTRQLKQENDQWARISAAMASALEMS
jgi:PadR family transcriptional regulator, regulatory protein PadR